MNLNPNNDIICFKFYLELRLLKLKNTKAKNVCTENFEPAQSKSTLGLATLDFSFFIYQLSEYARVVNVSLANVMQVNSAVKTTRSKNEAKTNCISDAD